MNPFDELMCIYDTWDYPTIIWDIKPLPLLVTKEQNLSILSKIAYVKTKNYSKQKVVRKRLLNKRYLK